VRFLVVFLLVRGNHLFEGGHATVAARDAHGDVPVDKFVQGLLEASNKYGSDATEKYIARATTPDPRMASQRKAAEDAIRKQLTAVPGISVPERMKYGSMKGFSDTRCHRQELIGSEGYDRFSHGSGAIRESSEEERLVWSPEAEALFSEALTANQFPPDCHERKLLLAELPVYQGLMSNFHFAQVQLLMALKLNRTLVAVRPKSFNKGKVTSPDLYELDTFFSHWSGCQVVTKNEAGEEILPHGWRRSLALDKTGIFDIKGISTFRETFEALKSNPQTMFFLSDKGGFHLAPIIRHTVGKFWPADMWEAFRARSLVWTSHGNDIDAVNDNVKKFMLRAILARWMFTPNTRILDRAQKILRDASVEGPLRPSATMHVRRTDKKHEDPYYLEHESYRGVEEYALALNKKLGEAYPPQSTAPTHLKVLKLLTDSSSGLDEMNRHLGKEFPIATILSDAPPEELSSGHHLLPRELKVVEFEKFLAGMWVAATYTQFGVVTLTSNVGRVLLELLGAKYCVSQLRREGPLITSLDEAWITNP